MTNNQYPITNEGTVVGSALVIGYWLFAVEPAAKPAFMTAPRTAPLNTLLIPLYVPV
jgi:hypothetical protein